MQVGAEDTNTSLKRVNSEIVPDFESWALYRHSPDETKELSPHIDLEPVQLGTYLYFIREISENEGVFGHLFSAANQSKDISYYRNLSPDIISETQIASPNEYDEYYSVFESGSQYSHTYRVDDPNNEDDSLWIQKTVAVMDVTRANREGDVEPQRIATVTMQDVTQVHKMAQYLKHQEQAVRLLRAFKHDIGASLASLNIAPYFLHHNLRAVEDGIANANVPMNEQLEDGMHGIRIHIGKIESQMTLAKQFMESFSFEATQVGPVQQHTIIDAIRGIVEVVSASHEEVSQTHEFVFIDPHKDIPAEDLDRPVRTNLGSLERIMQNLLENAVKYSPAADVNDRKKVSIAYVPTPKGLQITFIDEGIGIDQDDFASIFELNHRVKKRETQEIGGTGLGLYVVAQLSRVTHTQISVRSKVGRGSAFTITVPYA